MRRIFETFDLSVREFVQDSVRNLFVNEYLYRISYHFDSCSKRDFPAPPLPSVNSVTILSETSHMRCSSQCYRKNYETYYWSARVQVWTISNNFLGLSRSILLFLYFGLSWSFWGHLGASRFIPVYLGLSWTLLDYLGLSRTISD